MPVDPVNLEMQSPLAPVIDQQTFEIKHTDRSPIESDSFETFDKPMILPGPIVQPSRFPAFAESSGPSQFIRPNAPIAEFDHDLALGAGKLAYQDFAAALDTPAAMQAHLPNMSLESPSPRTNNSVSDNPNLDFWWNFGSMSSDSFATRLTRVATIEHVNPTLRPDAVLSFATNSDSPMLSMEDRGLAETGGMVFAINKPPGLTLTPLELRLGQGAVPTDLPNGLPLPHVPFVTYKLQPTGNTVASDVTPVLFDLQHLPAATSEDKIAANETATVSKLIGLARINEHTNSVIVTHATAVTAILDAAALSAATSIDNGTTRFLEHTTAPNSNNIIALGPQPADNLVFRVLYLSTPSSMNGTVPSNGHSFENPGRLRWPEPLPYQGPQEQFDDEPIDSEPFKLKAFTTDRRPMPEGAGLLTEKVSFGLSAVDRAVRALTEQEVDGDRGGSALLHLLGFSSTLLAAAIVYELTRRQHREPLSLGLGLVREHSWQSEDPS